MPSAAELIHNKGDFEEWGRLNKGNIIYFMVVIRDKDSDDKFGKYIAGKGPARIEKFIGTLERIHIKEDEMPHAAIYVSLNPRCPKKATEAFMEEITKKLFNGVEISEPEKTLNRCYHKAFEHKKHTAFDIDTKELKVLEELKQSFEPFKDAQILCVETKNGFHVCFDKSILGKRNKEFNSLSFKKYQFEATARDGKPVIQDLCAQMNGDLIVCPGTLQRGFPTKLVKF